MGLSQLNAKTFNQLCTFRSLTGHFIIEPILLVVIVAFNEVAIAPAQSIINGSTSLWLQATDTRGIRLAPNWLRLSPILLGGVWMTTRFQRRQLAFGAEVTRVAPLTGLQMLLLTVNVHWGEYWPQNSSTYFLCLWGSTLFCDRICWRHRLISFLHVFVSKAIWKGRLHYQN